MSYHHKVEKFYEPFKKVSDVEKLIGKEVIIDNSISAIVKAVYWCGFLRIIFEANDGKQFNMFSTGSFDRVKIDGHRFGQEIEFE